jgi:hypothetical protein
MNEVYPEVRQGNADEFASMAIPRTDLAAEEADFKILPDRTQKATYPLLEEGPALDSFINDVAVFVACEVRGPPSEGVTHKHVLDARLTESNFQRLCRKVRVEFGLGVCSNVEQILDGLVA